MNRLRGQVSPYLVQHADNPVHWWPWGDEAFAAAKRAAKPVLLSIGYSACHWCHVMAHESFEDESTAALMNDLFINIKVDREERPDVDQVYMAALQAMGQQGGWPLTIFLDSDARPFWGGTYFPKTARYGQPAFANVLNSVHHSYQTRSDTIEQNASAILSALRRQSDQPEGSIPDAAWSNAVARSIANVYDPVHGGLNGAPKFPNPSVLELLWRAAERTGDESIRFPVLLTLERLARGGIFDHLGGGFARYSVDEIWLVPHFEKMLYDNAQLVPLMALAAHRTRSPLLANAAEKTVAWLLRDMMTEGGAFAASEDADSAAPDGHMEEGAFYTWTPQEIVSVLGEQEAEGFCAAYDITRRGNFEERNIPNLLSRDGLADAALTRHAAQCQQLLEARNARARPHRDDKILADWNGLMITGLVRAGALLQKREWIEAAKRAFDGVCHHLGDESELAHAYRAGKHIRPGFAADYAAMSLAAISLYEVGYGASLVEQAEIWCRILLDRYVNESGVLAMTPAGEKDLPIRPGPTHDDAVPNANGLTAEAMIRLFGLTGKPQWLAAADALLEACAGAMRANPFGHASLLSALDLRQRRADITIHASGDDELNREALLVPYPNRTLRREHPGTTPFATVCMSGQCSLPITRSEQLRARIETDLAPAKEM